MSVPPPDAAWNTCAVCSLSSCLRQAAFQFEAGGSALAGFLPIPDTGLPRVPHGGQVSNAYFIIVFIILVLGMEPRGLVLTRQVLCHSAIPAVLKFPP